MTIRAILIVALIACGKSEKPSAGRGSAGSAAVPTSRVAKLVGELRSSDKQVSMRARDELRDGKFTVDESVELLRATTQDFGEQPEHFIDAAGWLVLAAKPDPRVVPIVEELFPKWSVKAKQAGLNLLSRIDDDAAVRALVKLLPTVAIDDPDLALGGINQRPHHAPQIVPALMALKGDDHLRNEVYRTLLGYCDKGLVKPPLLVDKTPALLAEYRGVRDELAKLRVNDAAYQEPREHAALLLDLFACVPDEDVARELTATLSHADARLVYFAMTSLEEFGREPAPATLERVAASPEMRFYVIEHLEQKHQLAKLPARYRTQAAIAEAEMVRWLMYPTELGHAPEQIKLGKIVTRDTGGDGPLDTYVFKFKTEDGWLAGIAGPYLRKEQPTTKAYGGTFSAFEPWQAKTPEQHAARIQKILDDWQRLRAAE